MVCRKCGEKFSDNLIICPKCGAENNRKPSKKKKVNPVVKIAIIVSIIVVAAAFALFLILTITSNSDKSNADKNIQKMESYYKQKKYDQIDDYIKDLDYDVAYAKYNLVSSMHERMKWQIDTIKRDSKVLTKENTGYTLDPATISYDIQICAETLAELNKLEEEGYVYQEEQAVKDFKEEIYEALKEKFMLSEDEINEVAVIAKTSSEAGTSGDYSKYGEQVVKRLTE